MEWLKTHPQKDKIVAEVWFERMPRQSVSRLMYRLSPEDLNSD